MEATLESICRYLDFLIGEVGYRVTLHGDFVAVPALVRYNMHLNPYCTYVKTVLGCGGRCAEKQRRVLEKSREGAFFGVCYAGVGEYVYPVTVRGETVGFVSVGGYRGLDEAAAQSRARRFAAREGIPEGELLRMRAAMLAREIPERGRVDAVIYPLLLMLENHLTAREAVLPREEDLYTRLYRYVTLHHNTPVTMARLARAFHVSVSTLSHLFRRRSGMSISEYVAKLRLDDAAWLLTQSAFSLTEIAEIVGYCNPAYFSSAFKTRFGVTPRAWRQGRRGAPPDEM